MRPLHSANSIGLSQHLHPRRPRGRRLLPALPQLDRRPDVRPVTTVLDKQHVQRLLPYCISRHRHRVWFPKTHRCLCHNVPGRCKWRCYAGVESGRGLPPPNSCIRRRHDGLLARRRVDRAMSWSFRPAFTQWRASEWLGHRPDLPYVSFPSLPPRIRGHAPQGFRRRLPTDSLFLFTVLTLTVARV